MSTTTLTTPQDAGADNGSYDDSDFDLDVRIIASGPVIPELLRSTSDNCGKTCASACTSCKS